jgi:hypothetical protein
MQEWARLQCFASASDRHIPVLKHFVIKDHGGSRVKAPYVFSVLDATGQLTLPLHLRPLQIV